MSYLIIDLGTTSIKTSLIAEDGSVQAFTLKEYTLDTPSESIVEFEAQKYWEYVQDGIRELTGTPGISAGDIKSAAISSQAETLVVLDEFGNPLMPAVNWLDSRSHKEARELEEALGVGRTGLAEMTATWPATKILWLRRNRPDIFARAAKYLMLEDYILYMLTGEYAGEYTLYSTSALLDSYSKTWWKEMLDYLEIGEHQLSELHNSGELVGTILPSVARELGLSDRTAAVTGAMDQVAGMVGAGNICEEIITETTGGAFVVCRTLDRMPGENPEGTSIQCHAVPGKYLVTGWCAAGGLSYKWLREAFFTGMIHEGRELNDEGPLFALMDKLAGRISIGSQGLLFYPFMAGPGTLPLDPMAKGCFYGIELHHTKAHFARSVMESIAFILQEILENMTDDSAPAKEIRSMGGGAKSSLWNSIKADATGLPVRTLNVTETASLGTAILSAKALGQYRSIEEGVSHLVYTHETFEPDRGNYDAYRSAYKKFREIENRFFGRR